ncbi:homoserine dehydrogenase [Pacificimonas flava]|uniref:Homoserine dehydrogenase n=2 Tax=Pacificimonas TaxID=1960290 RepID=A0A219B1Z5_9SPHN|nr:MULTISPECIES: homoserine dehydrogenase [Pacificimonas]MBZ6379713.1 homoserine dehydrogenase [Pacificimonas aurantium]OWV31829.1 homoserine dehydrogenase [Pacificimonas flava]
MTEPLRIAIAGLGTVGAGVVRLLTGNAELITARAGRPIEIVAVNARERKKDRGVDLTPYRWQDDLGLMAEADDVDVVVELIGGSDGPAIAFARKALKAGKGLVSANKAMIAHHGAELATLAEEAGKPLKFEAAVAGGIPVIKALGGGAAANEISSLFGILNGTCNYILSEMEQKGSNFADVLKEAQALGYAEADPTFDIDGIDAAHKLAILASLAFGTQISFEEVETRGIREIEAVDIERAAALGYRIRLVGETRYDDGRLFQRVHPVLVPVNHPLAKVDGSLNAVVADGNFVGRLTFEGAGAGAGPTASAVVADIIDIARGELQPAFGVPASALAPAAPAHSDAGKGRSYVRVAVADEPGVMADLTAILRDCDVSIESLIQRGDAGDGGVFIAMITHETEHSRLAEAVRRMADCKAVLSQPMRMDLLD